MGIFTYWDTAIREMGTRRQARILALQTLYEVDTVGHDPEVALNRLIEDKAMSPKPTLYARELITGVMERKEEIDATIERFAPQFPVEEISPIDRNILRLAIFEILFDNRVPVKAAINEAVELAKGFGSDSSPRFVNGVLGSISPLAKR